MSIVDAKLYQKQMRNLTCQAAGYLDAAWHAVVQSDMPTQRHEHIKQRIIRDLRYLVDEMRQRASKP